MVMSLFEEWRTVAPDKWVAYNSHGILAWSFGEDRYRNAEFDAWIHEVDGYLRDRAKVMELRRRYLTPEQIIQSEAIENDP